MAKDGVEVRCESDGVRLSVVVVVFDLNADTATWNRQSSTTKETKADVIRLYRAAMLFVSAASP